MVVFICLLCGAVLGLTMGTLIHFLELPPFLVTLVGMFLARGLSFMISLDSVPIRNELFLSISKASIPLGNGVKLPAYAVIFIFVVLLSAYVLHYTRFGRNIYAIGDNEKSAVLMGLPVGRTKVLIYTLNSTICALGGLVYSLYTLAGYPLAGTGLELDVITAVVIGGTLLTGGVGFVEGTLFGVLILGLIQTIITFQGNLSTWWTKVFISILLCLFILLQRYLSAGKIKSRNKH
jgi:ribose/xylose/arabinose/galactoside ABC-type transport system permease subunit